MENPNIMRRESFLTLAENAQIDLSLADEFDKKQQFAHRVLSVMNSFYWVMVS